jgi:hypothetical protein
LLDESTPSLLEGSATSQHRYPDMARIELWELWFVDEPRDLIDDLRD